MELHVANLQAFSRALDRAAMHPRRPGRPTLHARILAALSQHRRIWSTQELADHLYQDDPDGGPDYVQGIISRAVMQMRRKGVPIKTEGARGYYLEAEARTCGQGQRTLTTMEPAAGAAE